MADWNQILESLLKYTIDRDITQLEIIKSDKKNKWDLIIKINYEAKE